MSNEVEKLIQEWSNVILTQDKHDDVTNEPISITPTTLSTADEGKHVLYDLDKELTDLKKSSEQSIGGVNKGLKANTNVPLPSSEINNNLELGGTEGLTQQEIDALLGVASEAEVAKSGFEVLTDTKNVGKNRLVLLDILYGRLVRRASGSLRKFSSDSIDIHLEQTELIRFGSYLNTIPLPAMIGVFRAEEWDNYGLITLDSDLIYSIIEVLLGGHRAHGQLNQSRAFTQLDTTLVEKFINVILDDLTTAFDPIFPVSMRLERIETNPRFASFTIGSNLSHLGRFQIEFDNRSGKMEILFPLSTLEPVREILTQSFMGEKFGRDTTWEHHFRSSINSTYVNLDTLLADMYVSLTSLKSWQPGKIIPLGVKPDSLVTLSCNGRSIFKGLMGKTNGKIAVQIKKRISISNRSNATVLI